MKERDHGRRRGWRGQIFIINKLIGRVLKIGESQHVGFRKLETDDAENSESDDKRWSDK